MDKIDLLTFIIFYLLIAGMILTFLWAVREIWRRYIKPLLTAPKSRPFIHFGGD